MEIFGHNDTTYFVLGEIMRLHYLRLHSLLDDIGLYPGQSRLLFVLVHHGDGLSQREISEKLNIAPATLTVMIKRMEKEGLISRQQDPSDQRISRVYITDGGRKVFKESLVILDTISNDCFGSLTADEKDELNNLLKKVKDNLSKTINNK